MYEYHVCTKGPYKYKKLQCEIRQLYEKIVCTARQQAYMSI